MSQTWYYADHIQHKDSLNISFNELKSCIPIFPTKGAALNAGKSFGWREAIILQSPFERVWVVGKKDFQPDEIAGITRDCFRLPMLRWELGQDGIERCPVLKVYRVRTP